MLEQVDRCMHILGMHPPCCFSPISCFQMNISTEKSDVIREGKDLARTSFILISMHPSPHQPQSSLTADTSTIHQFHPSLQYFMSYLFLFFLSFLRCQLLLTCYCHPTVHPGLHWFLSSTVSLLLRQYLGDYWD